MSGYMSEKVNDLNSHHVAAPAPRRFRMGRCESPAQLAENLRAAVIGQDGAVDAVVRALTIAAAGIGDPHRPIASLLFVGPTGVGKTELARRVAAEVTGNPDKLCRIDMNSLAQEHYSASITGAPPGYAGSKEQFTLFQRDLVEGNLSRPGIVLFDEVEKAHATVLRSLLQILDSGTLRLAAGTSQISFRNAIVLLTSNLGSAELADRLRGPANRAARFRKLMSPMAAENPEAVVLAAVEKFFDPELFNRFDEVVMFRPLRREDARAIVDREMAGLRDRLAADGISWTPDQSVREHLVDIGFDEVYGARNLQRAIRTRLHAPIADVIVAADPGQTSLSVTTAVSDGRIVARR